MKTTSTIIFLSLFIAAACGRQPDSVSALAASTQQACEVEKQLVVRPMSEFPASDTDVYRVATAKAQAKCVIGGFGWSIHSWDLVFDVEVFNLAYDKRFVVEPLATGITSRRAVLEPNRTLYQGQTDDGYDRFTFSQNLLSLESVRLSVIMPARYNRTPDIGNPVVGWYGPTYGLILDPSTD